MKDFSFISDTINEKLRECAVLGSLSRGTHRTSSTTIASRCQSDRRSQRNSHIYILTDMLLDETPEIHSHYKNFLIVYQTEVFLEKKNCAYVSVSA